MRAADHPEIRIKPKKQHPRREQLPRVRPAEPAEVIAQQRNLGQAA